MNLSDVLEAAAVPGAIPQFSRAAAERFIAGRFRAEVELDKLDAGETHEDAAREYYEENIHPLMVAYGVIIP